MFYKIDNATVVLAGLRSSEQPANAQARYARVPGVLPITAIQPEPAGGGTVTVQGVYHAVGADFEVAYSALVNQLETWRKMQHDGSTHRVGLYGVTYPDCQLDRFETSNRERFSRSASDGSGTESGWRVRVRFSWRRLTEDIQ